MNFNLLAHPLHFLAKLFGFTKDPTDMYDGEIPSNYKPDPKIDIIRYLLQNYFSSFYIDCHESFYDEIKKSDEGYVSIEYFLKCAEIQEMKATAQDLIDAASSSLYLETDGAQIRSKIPYSPDPNRLQHSIHVSNFENDTPDFYIKQFIEFIPNFKPIKSMVMGLYKNFDGQYSFSGDVYCELNSEENAKLAAERKLTDKDGNKYDVNLLTDYSPFLSENIEQ